MSNNPGFRYISLEGYIPIKYVYVLSRGETAMIMRDLAIATRLSRRARIRWTREPARDIDIYIYRTSDKLMTVQRHRFSGDSLNHASPIVQGPPSNRTKSRCARICTRAAVGRCAFPRSGRTGNRRYLRNRFLDFVYDWRVTS